MPLLPAHEAVHATGRQVVAAVLEGERAAALDAYARMEDASQRVLECLDLLIARHAA